MKKCTHQCVALLLLLCPIQLLFAQSGQWKPLFNGKDLSGWDTYLRQPERTTQTPFGLNNDPLKVFTVVDGAIRTSGQIWGGISTRQEFENYHLRFAIKWGEKKWYPTPNDTIKRDAGLLYHATGPFSFAYDCWLRSNEMQIQEGEIGDFFGVGGGSAEFPMKKTTVRGKVLDQYDLNAPLQRNADAIGAGRVYRSGDFERPHGQWNLGELITRGADAVYIVNGFVVNRLFNTYRPALQQQTTRGKLQFQSEGAEVFYKQIEWRPVTFSPSGKLTLKANPQQIDNISSGKPQAVQIINQGDAVELVAVELIGAANDLFIVKLPAFPLRLKRGESFSLPVTIKSGTMPGTTVKLRLETVLGPVPDFEVSLKSR